MKSFHHYLTESVKQYEYRIKIAGELDPAMLEELEKMMAKYDIVKMSSPKKTPVMTSPAGFPELKNEEVHIIDVIFNYPPVETEVVQMWKRLGGNPNYIRLMTKSYDDSVSAECDSKEESPVLEKDYPESTAAPASPEDAIQNSAKGAKFEIAGGKTAAAETTNDLPQGTKSPIPGTNQKPVPKSSAR